MGLTRGLYHLRPHPSVECEIDGEADCDDVDHEYELQRDYYLFAYSAGWFTKVLLLLYGYGEFLPPM
ncbi:hypothetical protein [Natronoglomus mannanivorans]|uniref:Uncharacterized protein n=1 Tax=Natronoglomus mannanivorans TaxID=2979990 RepID=A0AAP3E494_9EURY|nr:hypothetical protein [Halobacteria archaeon AArc-xg1-1]